MQKNHLWINWLKGYALNKIVVILSLPLIFLKCVGVVFQRSRLCIREHKRSHFKTGSLIGVKVYKMPLPARLLQRSLKLCLSRQIVTLCLFQVYQVIQLPFCVIEADAEHSHCQDYRNWIYNLFKGTDFKKGGNHWSEIEKNMDKRGPNGIRVLEPIPDAKPKADKPIRAVGLREEAMRAKIRVFQEKGWIVPSRSHWVNRGFLVPETGRTKRRLVIDYRYVNTQLRGCEFPLPVIEDLFVEQAGNQLWTILDLEDGFHQMPLSECSRHYTAFCSPFWVFEWRILPIRVEVGPQAF